MAGFYPELPRYPMKGLLVEGREREVVVDLELDGPLNDPLYLRNAERFPPGQVDCLLVVRPARPLFELLGHHAHCGTGPGPMRRPVGRLPWLDSTSSGYPRRVDPFDINSLFPQLVLALGAALAGGNGLALWHDRQGKRPEGLGELRVGRARWLIAVGVVMMVWGLATVLG